MIDYEKLDAAAPVGDFSTFDSEVVSPAVAAIPEDGVYLEVGVNKGKSLFIARQVAKKSVKVYGVDVRDDPKVEGTIFMQGDSKKLPKGWDTQIDVLFIDGDHSYKGCLADINTWSPFVKDGGIIFFHDADEGGVGVLQAILEYITTTKRPIHRWQMHKKTDKNTSVTSIQL